MRAASIVTSELLDAAKGKAAEATIYRGVGAAYLSSVSRLWRTSFDDLRQAALMRGVPAAALPEHGHWDWERKERVIRVSQPDAQFLAIECEGETQGLMMVTFHKTSQIVSQIAQSLVYVDYLESAPWNVEPLANAPRYRAVGSVLLEQAILISEERGFDARIGLHSLRQSERFYAGKMTDMGIDPSVEFLRYFEMTP